MIIRGDNTIGLFKPTLQLQLQHKPCINHSEADPAELAFISKTNKIEVPPSFCHPSHFLVIMFQITIGQSLLSSVQVQVRTEIALNCGCCWMLFFVCHVFYQTKSKSKSKSMSLFHYVTMSLCHYVTILKCHNVKMSICQNFTMSLCHYITTTTLFIQDLDFRICLGCCCF